LNFADGGFDELLLVMMRVGSACTAEDDLTLRARMRKLPMTALAAGRNRPACSFQIRNQFANLPGHLDGSGDELSILREAEESGRGKLAFDGSDTQQTDVIDKFRDHDCAQMQ
jgi:hypothetical protein